VTDEPGWALTRLIEIHTAMRDDLALLRRAVAAITANADDADAVAEAFAVLSIRTPGWSLNRYCAAFCGFVHEHHSVEDSVMFPMLLEHGDGLQPVIAKLRADHLLLTRYLDETERALTDLPGDAAATTAAVSALERLVEHLAAHLDFEEVSLTPALTALSTVVSEDDVPAPPADHLGVTADG